MTMNFLIIPGYQEIYSNLDIWKIAILVTKNNINNQTNILERENIL